MSATEKVYRKLLTKSNDETDGCESLTKTDIEQLLDWNNFTEQRTLINKIVSEFNLNNLEDNVDRISDHLTKLCHNYNLNVYSDHNDKITIIINTVLTECDKKLEQLENNRILAFPIMLPFIETFTHYIMKIILLKVVSLKVKILMTTIIVKNILCLHNNKFENICPNITKASHKSIIEHLMDRNDVRPEDEDYNMWITLKYLFFVYIMFNRPMWLSSYPMIQWETCWNEIFFWECLNFVDEILTHKIERFRKEYQLYQSSIPSLQRLKNLFTFTTVPYPSVKCECDGPIFLFLAQAFRCTNIIDDVLVVSDTHGTMSKVLLNMVQLNKSNDFNHSSLEDNNLCDKLFWDNYNQYPDVLSQVVSYGFVVVSNMTTDDEVFSIEMIFKILKYVTMNRKSCELIHEHISENIVVYRAIQNSQKSLLNDNIIQPNYLVYYIVELVKSFIGGYLNRKIPYCMFCDCLVILKNCFLFQVQTHTQRHNTNFVTMWTLLFSLLNFVCQKSLFVVDLCEDEVSESTEIVSNIVDIFDLFIVCGDDLLEGPSCYDRLYYEIIRNQELLLELHNRLAELASGVSLSNCLEIVCSGLVKSLNNFKAIIKHFMPIISETGTKKKLGCVDECELLDLIGSNYGNLNLQVSAKIHAPSEAAPTIDLTQNQIDIIIENTKKYITDIQDVIENLDIEKQ